MNVLHIVIVYVVLLVALAFFMSYSAIAKEKNRQLEEENKNLKENLKEKINAITSSKKMKPKDKHQSNETILFGSCPSCDCVVSSKEKFCSKCGQKIDWGEEVTQ